MPNDVQQIPPQVAIAVALKKLIAGGMSRPSATALMRATGVQERHLARALDLIGFPIVVFGPLS